tara:strand:- start:269 stop:538 length:270 start_codon:yes stop_codon:yes gene_type:complete
MSERFEFHKTVEVVPPQVNNSVTHFLKWAFDTQDIDYSVDIGQLMDIFKEADPQVLAAKRIAPFKIKRWLDEFAARDGCVVVIDKEQAF